MASLTFTIDVATSLTLYNVLVGVAGCVSDTGIGVASGDTIIVANNFTHTRDRLLGAWEVQGNYTVASTAEGGDGTVTMTGTGSKTYTYTAGSEGGSHLRINNAALSVSANAGTTALKITQFTLLAGTFTAPTGTMTIEPSSSTPLNIFLLSSGTFNHNNGTIVFSPRSNCGGPAWFTVDVVTSLTLYNINFDDSGGCSGLSSLTTAAGDTIIAANSFTHTDGYLYGVWQVQGNYTVASTADGGTAGITFTGGNNQTYTDQGGNEVDGDVTINKSSGAVRLASNADWNAASQDVTITSGELNMGGSYNISTTALAVAAAGHLSNNGTGDLTLAGNVSNSGNIRFRGNGTCGGTDDILIRSSSTGVQRTWSGSGVYLFHDVDVRDMAGSAVITLYSSTSTANNGANWTFSGAACPAQPPAAGLSTGKINLQSGKLNLR